VAAAAAEDDTMGTEATVVRRPGDMVALVTVEFD
jgi:hypothetical protein